MTEAPPVPEPPANPPEAPADAVEKAAKSRNPSTTPDKDQLRSLGVSKKQAMRVLACGGSERFLNTKVTARVLMVHHANSVQQLEMMQKKAAIVAKDKNTEPRLRAACFQVVPQCAMALARLSEVMLATARSLDVPEDEGPKPKVQPVQNNFFGFPPVSTGRFSPPLEPAKNGNDATVDVAEVGK